MGEKLSIFEQYLTVWVLLCIAAGILLGKAAPGIATTLNDLSIHQVSVPIAACLFFMMYPIMVKIDFAQVVKSVKTPKPVLLTLFINWAVKPFSMFAIVYFLSVIYSGISCPVQKPSPAAKKSSCGGAISQAQFCWALRPVPQ